MPKSFALEIKTPAGIILPIRGAFPDAEWERVQEFTRYAKELIELPLVGENSRWPDLNLRLGTPENPVKLKSFKKGTRPSLELTDGAPLTVDASSQPPKSEVDALLHRLRPFIFQQSEDDQRTFFPGVLKLLSRRIPCPPLWGPLKDRFAGKRTARMMQLQITKDGVTRELISDQALSDWLNAFEFHRNAKKAAQFNEIRANHIARDAVRALMLTLLAEKATAIVRVGMVTYTLESGSDFSSIRVRP